MPSSIWIWVWFFFGAIFAAAVLAKLATMFWKRHPNIAVVSVNGILSYDNKPESVFSRVQKSLEMVAKNKKTRALILRVNSPGGTVGASQEIYELLFALRKKGIKIVVMMEDVAASGGLYISLAADSIIAKSGTVTGSIGVILKSYDFSAWVKKLEVAVNVIRSGAYKDILSSTRPMTVEEHALLLEMILDTNEQFRQTIFASRKIAMEKIHTFADGRILNGAQAMALGLVDDCGGFPTAKEAAEDLAGLVAGQGIAEEVKPKVSPLDRLASALERFNFLGRAGVLKELAPQASGLSNLPLWLMPGYDL